VWKTFIQKRESTWRRLLLDTSEFSIKTEYITGQRILVQLQDCMLYEHMQSEGVSQDMDVKFKCSDIDEVSIFTTQPGQYFMEIENMQKGRFLSVAYCSNGGESFDKVQESFESLPLHRLNISRVEVYSACGVAGWLQDRWINFLEERAMHARVPGAEADGAVGRVPIEVGGCMIYERLRPESVPSIMDVKFRCFNMEEVHLFSEELGFYLIEVRPHSDGGYKMEVTYCPDDPGYYRQARVSLSGETLPRHLAFLPLHRLNISELEVYPVC